MQYNADKQTNAAQRRLQRHHGAQDRKGGRVDVSHLIHVDGPPLSTYAPDKMAMEAYSKLLSHVFGPLCIASTTSLTNDLYQEGASNDISADQASVAPPQIQSLDNIIDDKHDQSLSNTSMWAPGNSNK